MNTCDSLWLAAKVILWIILVGALGFGVFRLGYEMGITRVGR